MKSIIIIICIFTLTGCATNKSPKPVVQSNSNLSGEWTYLNSKGIVKVSDDGQNVNMEMSYLPKGGVMPHYSLSTVKSGDQLNGTWKCVSKTLRNCDFKSYKISIRVSNYNTSMVVTSAEDPYRYGWNSRIVMTKNK